MEREREREGDRQRNRWERKRERERERQTDREGILSLHSSFKKTKTPESLLPVDKGGDAYPSFPHRRFAASQGPVAGTRTLLPAVVRSEDDNGVIILFRELQFSDDSG